MSKGGKITLIVVGSISLVVIIIGIVIWSFFNSYNNAIDDAMYNYNDAYEDVMDDYEDAMDDYEDAMDDYY